MAARQGLSAQISQASEDAKRAVLQRAPLKSSWFSNLNTTCTIKSAPPRTPEVLHLLGTKCGWLIKRNEQHVWQSRWCCIVPHTFLYYFDADIGVSSDSKTTPSAVPPAAVQEALNQAVRDGFRGGNTAPRSSLYNVFPSGPSGEAAAIPQPPNQQTNNPELLSDEKFNSLQPAGIIDLECYSAVHRSSLNDQVLELAGDESVNPDLRSFYFCAGSNQESEEWTQALLSMRHQALVDEREAFREVCDGFAQQLQQLHSDIEESRTQQEEATEECYRVRSASEEQRRNSIRVISEALERTSDASKYKRELETVHSQDMGVVPAVRLLSDYTRDLEQSLADVKDENEELREQLRRTNDSDHVRVQELRRELQQQTEEYSNEKRQLQRQVSTLQQKLQQSQKQVKVAQHEATTQRGDLKTQVTTLTTHKKILKKEVVDLRQKLKDLAGELSTLRHVTKSAKMDLDQERKKGELLNRYIEKIEGQVRVQQNMMEYMSSSVAGSVRGNDDNNSFYVGASSPGVKNVVLVDSFAKTTPPSNVRRSNNTPNNKNSNRSLLGSPPPPDSSSSRKIEEEDAENVKQHKELMRQAQEIVDMENDDKSHVSELTEDRTQRQFDAAYRSAAYQMEAAVESSLLGKMGSNRNMVVQQQQQLRQQQNAELAATSSSGDAGVVVPSFIGVGADDPPPPDLMESSESPRPKLDTINNFSSASLGGLPPSASKMMRSNSSSNWTVDSNGSVVSKMSVAQRARLEAEQKSTPVNVRTFGTSSSRRRREKSPSAASLSSQGSFFTKLENRIVAAIDNSVLGVPDDLLEDSSSRGSNSRSDDSSQEEPMMSPSTSEHSRSEENKRLKENQISPRSRSERLRLASQKNNTLTTAPLTLEERQAMQRQKQLEFLKTKGLLKDNESASDAGASSTVSNNSSSSFRRRLLGRRRIGGGSRSRR